MLKALGVIAPRVAVARVRARPPDLQVAWLRRLFARVEVRRGEREARRPPKRASWVACKSVLLILFCYDSLCYQ